MLDLSSIPADVIQARGQYATVRAAHEDAKKELSVLCGQLAATASQILRTMQPEEEPIPIANVCHLIDSARCVIGEIEELARKIESLAEQRAALKTKAWK